MKLTIAPGTTSRTVRVFIQDSSSTTGDGLTGLVFNSAGLSAYYLREGDASPTTISLVTATVGTWTSGGFKEVDPTNMPGVYELGLPDAVLAASADDVVVMLKGATNMAQSLMEIQLSTSSGTIDANVVSISGDTGAADNLEADYDGTGYAKTNSTIGTATTIGATGLAAIWGYVLESTLTATNFMRLILSGVAGKTTDGGIKFRDIADSKNRIDATVDGSGNRTSITLDGS